jgi:hypothetical protein
MSRLLEQGVIHCPKCGDYMWTYTHTIFNVDTSTEEEREKSSFCGKCNRGTYIQMLKSADKIVPAKFDERGDRQKP